MKAVTVKCAVSVGEHWLVGTATGAARVVMLPLQVWQLAWQSLQVRPSWKSPCAQCSTHRPVPGTSSKLGGQDKQASGPEPEQDSQELSHGSQCASSL